MNVCMDFAMPTLLFIVNASAFFYYFSVTHGY